MNTIKTHYNLSEKQINLLIIIYRFRFVTALLLGQYKNITAQSMKRSLNILEDSGYIDKRYSSSYKLQGKSTTLLTAVATIAEFSAGEYRTAIFTSTAVLETLIIVLLGLKYGHTKYTPFDVICQVGALFGFVLWAIFNSPAAAVIFAVSIDFIGALPTIRHSWLKPGEETWITFAMAGAGGLLAIFARTSFNWTSLTYAVYIVLINIFISAILIGRANSHSRVKA
jgi:hypothetical protein